MIKKLANLTILLIILFSMNSVAIAANQVVFNISQEILVFTDMHGHWAQETVNWAVQKGVVTGYTDGTFKPANEVTESEFLAMLIRVYKPDLKPIAGAHWAQHYYKLAHENNYPVGKDSRNTIVTRGYVAELVAATQGVNYVGDNAIQYLLGNGLAKGTEAGKVTIPSYNAKGKLSRAEAVQFIKNLIEKGKQELEVRPEKPSDVTQLPSLPGSGAVTNPGGSVTIGNTTLIPKNEMRDTLDPYHELTSPLVTDFVKSVFLKDGKVHFTAPDIPKGYKMTITYIHNKDISNYLDWNKQMINPEKGDYSIEINKGGYLTIGFSEKSYVKSSANIYLPEMKVQMNNEGEWFK